MSEFRNNMTKCLCLTNSTSIPELLDSLVSRNNNVILEEIDRYCDMKWFVDTKSFNMILDWESSECRSHLKKHSQLNTSYLHIPVVLYDSVSFKRWAQSVFSREEADSYVRKMISSYGLGSSHQASMIHETICILGTISNTINKKSDCVVAAFEFTLVPPP